MSSLSLPPLVPFQTFLQYLTLTKPTTPLLEEVLKTCQTYIEVKHATEQRKIETLNDMEESESKKSSFLQALRTQVELELKVDQSQIYLTRVRGYRWMCADTKVGYQPTYPPLSHMDMSAFYFLYRTLTLDHPIEECTTMIKAVLERIYPSGTLEEEEDKEEKASPLDHTFHAQEACRPPVRLGCTRALFQTWTQDLFMMKCMWEDLLHYPCYTAFLPSFSEGVQWNDLDKGDKALIEQLKETAMYQEWLQQVQWKKEMVLKGPLWIFLCDKWTSIKTTYQAWQTIFSTPPPSTQDLPPEYIGAARDILVKTIENVDKMNTEWTLQYIQTRPHGGYHPLEYLFQQLSQVSTVPVVNTVVPVARDIQVPVDPMTPPGSTSRKRMHQTFDLDLAQ